MSRFSKTKEQLPGYLQNAIFCIEQLTPLRFKNAQDWTMQNQGWVLEMQCDDCYDVFAKQKQVEFNIKAQFCHNPSTKCIVDDTSDFEELEYKEDNKFAIYLAN